MLVLACALAFACGEGRRASPTAPTPRYFLAAAGVMQNQSSFCCLRSVRVHLDGAPIQAFNYPQSGGAVIWNVNVDAAGGTHSVSIAPGSHEITVILDADPDAPARYLATGDLEITNESGLSALRIDLEVQMRQLSEGQGISWSFRL